jgi:hypothetical protein
MRTPRLPAVDWTDAPADLNGLVRFAERRNLVSARVPSHFKRSLYPVFAVWRNYCHVIQVNIRNCIISATGGGAVRWGTALQAGRSRVRFLKIIVGIFHWHNPSGSTIAVGLTQPLKHMNTRNISLGRCVKLTTLPPSYSDCPEMCLNLLEPSGPVQTCNGIDLNFNCIISVLKWQKYHRLIRHRGGWARCNSAKTNCLESMHPTNEKPKTSNYIWCVVDRAS